MIPGMTPDDSMENEIVRAEIAAVAARMIAEDGADYATAKHKAARQVLGKARPKGEFLPDNALIENEVRLYNALFFSDSQPARLLNLRQLALELMEKLAQFNPFLTGAVLNGTAGEHSDIHLYLFSDSPKDVEIYLLNESVDFSVSEKPHFMRHINKLVETVSFMWHQEGIHLALYEHDDLRWAQRSKSGVRAERISADALRKLIAGETAR